MSYEGPKDKSQEELDANFKLLEEKIHLLSNFLSDQKKVDKNDLEFIEGSWEVTVGGIGFSRKVDNATVKALQDIYDSLVELGAKSGFSSEEMAHDRLKLRKDNPLGNA